MSRVLNTLAAVTTLAVWTGCSSGPTGVTIEASTVLSVAPTNGATSVDPGTPVTITFSHAMMSGTEALVLLHKGSVTGPAVAAVASWSTDRSLTLRPTTPLEARTMYVIHLAPTVRDSDGTPLNHGGCAALGGQRVTSAMMGGGMMSGESMGPGMMGSGWQPVNGGYGMIFTFTTA